MAPTSRCCPKKRRALVDRQIHLSSEGTIRTITITECNAYVLVEFSNLRQEPPSSTTFAEVAQLIDVMADATAAPTKRDNVRFQEFACGD